MQAGLTQALLAQVSGVSVASIGRYESGRVSPTLDVLEQQASSTGLAVEINLALDRTHRDSEDGIKDDDEARTTLERPGPEPVEGIWTF